MTTYNIKDIPYAVLSPLHLAQLSAFATASLGHNTNVLSYDSSDSAYSFNDKGTKTIQLGKRFYSSLFKDKGVVSSEDFKEKYKRIAMVYNGAFYHEMFHHFFTPFNFLFRTINRINDYSTQTFVKEVANILEDISIEASGCQRYSYNPYIKECLELMSSAFKSPENIECMKESIATKPDSVTTLLNFLLLYCRGVDYSLYGPYQFFEDHKEFIDLCISQCVHTRDGEQRARRQMSFAFKLIKLLNPEDNTDENEEPPEGPVGPTGPTGPGGDGPIGPDESKGVEDTKDLEDDIKRVRAPEDVNIDYGPLKELQKHSDICDGSVKDDKPETLDTEEDKKEQEERSKASNKASSSSNLPPTASSTDMDIIKNNTGAPHILHVKYLMKNYYNPSDSNREAYDKYIKQPDTSAFIVRLSAIIRALRATAQPSWNHYRTSGKVDTSTMYKKDNLKPFKKKNGSPTVADLIVLLAIDLSGSMGGTKAELAGKATIRIAEALSRCGIPFSIQGFTTTEVESDREDNRWEDCCATICFKEYKEPYNNIKDSLITIVNNRYVKGVPLWSCNFDEVNIDFLGKELLSQPERDRVMIVLSDGATCGSPERLKEVAHKLEGQGVNILSIGLYSDEVKNIYTNNLIIESEEDLANLASFISKYLLGKVLK